LVDGEPSQTFPTTFSAVKTIPEFIRTFVNFNEIEPCNRDARVDDASPERDDVSPERDDTSPERDDNKTLRMPLNQVLFTQTRRDQSSYVSKTSGAGWQYSVCYSELQRQNHL